MNSLCIATWNLDYLPLNSDRAVMCRAKMEEVQAQVWVLTETQKGFYPGDNYHLVVETKEAADLAVDRRWVAIWASKSIAIFRPIKTRDQERTACTYLEFSSGEILNVYGTIMPWLGSTWDNQPSVGGQAFLNALEQQKKDWIDLQNAYPQAMLCVAGDYNQDLLKSGHYYGSRIQREALRKALEQAQLVCHTGGDMDPVAKCNPDNANIDHICLGGPQNISLVKTNAWFTDQAGNSVSDHFGISVEFNYS